MSDFRDTPTSPGSGTAASGTGTAASGASTPAASGTSRTASSTQHADARVGDADRFEHERIGIHNEAETVRRDRIRWGPVWAGIVTAIGSYLFLQLALISTGIIEFGDTAGDAAIISGIAALVAFFLGGVMTGATAMWQGADDGVLHGIVMWFAALVAIIVISAIGSGVALGTFDTTDVFDEFGLDELDVDQANEDAQDAAGKALLALTLGLAAAAGGGALGAKLWPKDDAFVDVVTRKDSR
jgi:hypothetical protein